MVIRLGSTVINCADLDLRSGPLAFPVAAGLHSRRG
jgi:hypothetical protein